MPIELSWYIPKRVVRAHVYGEAGIEQITQMLEDIQPYLDEGIPPIHVLLDDVNGEPPPISLKQLKAVFDVAKQPVENLGWVIGVGNVNAIAKVVIPMLLKIVQIKYVRVNNMDEALTVLKKQDMSLQAVRSENKQ